VLPFAVLVFPAVFVVAVVYGVRSWAGVVLTVVAAFGLTFGAYWAAASSTYPGVVTEPPAGVYPNGDDP